jgi:hypothetical protein
MTKVSTIKTTASLTHDAASCINVSTAEMVALFEKQQGILGGPDKEMTIAGSRPLTSCSKTPL